MAQNPVTTTTTESTPVVQHSGKEIGTTTIGASGAAGTGAGLGAALGAIIVFTLGASGIDVSPIEWAIVALCSAGVSFAAGLIGGKFSPTNKANETAVTKTELVEVPLPTMAPAGPVTAQGVPNFAAVPGGTSEVVPAAEEAPVASEGGSTARHRADVPAN